MPEFKEGDLVRTHIVGVSVGDHQENLKELKTAEHKHVFVKPELRQPGETMSLCVKCHKYIGDNTYMNVTIGYIPNVLSAKIAPLFEKFCDVEEFYDRIGATAIEFIQYPDENSIGLQIEFNLPNSVDREVALRNREVFIMSGWIRGSEAHKKGDTMILRIDFDRESDGLWKAEIPELRNVIAHGDSKNEVIKVVKVLALETIAKLIDQDRMPGKIDSITFLTW